MEIEKFRKMRKATFWMNRGTYKLSTVFSFKGWETPVLFYIIETGNNSGMYRTYDEDAEEGFVPVKFSDELVYTGLSRCKGKLYIINIDYDEHPGNNRYDAFFTSLPSSIISCEVHQQNNDSSKPPMKSFEAMKDDSMNIERRPFTDEEINIIDSNVVVKSITGKSVKFTMKGGGYSFLPLSDNSVIGLGRSVDLHKARLVISRTPQQGNTIVLEVNEPDKQASLESLSQEVINGWTVKDRRPFSQKEIDAVEDAVVVASKYGNSVCFHMKLGGITFIPLSINSTKGCGESIDLRKASVLTLSKRNEADITRVECKD